MGTQMRGSTYGVNRHVFGACKLGIVNFPKNCWKFSENRSGKPTEEFGKLGSKIQC